MKIEIELPDWCDERAIYIMAGIELAAYKVPFQPWMIKTGRCNMCGICCMILTKHIFPVENGKCIHLQKEPGKNNMWRCALGLQRPFGCSVGHRDYQFCTEKFEEVK